MGCLNTRQSWQAVLAGQRGLVGKQWAPQRQRQSQIAQAAPARCREGKKLRTSRITGP